ncbi:ferredoxin [Desulfosporosinus orientis DSM 765]|uniref:Ferredoxin n=1 Tax=Desulfosporosinus orientis (strain ATCC 19365 / DSM 765 / NCIMB 8382 / VKM B-1628 / Singapore I) TaxID=768706 RepID=G7WFX7_DESOD|nr:ferredoxin [Desulfosporosinus orientis]AET69492.1 ferredoxin [Desulfosporosinus orientis DSM 765]
MFATVSAECIGCGACTEVCPQIFRMNSYDIAEAYTNPVPADAEECAKTAARSCPVSAIILE